MATAPDVDDQEDDVGDHDDEQGIKELKQEITCPLCLDTFREPKLLSCDHVYCKSPCLEALLVRSKNSTISCPECRVTTQVTANEVDNLRTAFHINRLKEVVARMKLSPFQTLRTVSVDEAGIPAGGRADCLTNMLCKLHPSQSLDIYCSTCTCQRLICRDCVVVDRTHENHDYDLVEKVAPGYKKALLEGLNPVQETQGKVTEALIQVKKAKEQVASHGDVLEQKITDSYDEIATALQQQKEVLVRRIQELEKADIQELNGQKKNLCIASDELASLVTSAQAASKLSDQEFFSQRQELLSKIIGLTTRFKTDLSLTPAVTFPHISVRTVNPAQKVDELCKEFSIVCEPVDPTKCYAVEVQNVAFIDEPSSFKVYLLDSNGNPCTINQNVQVELKSLRFGSVLPTQVTAVSSSCYYVVYIPQLHTRGRYQLDIMVNMIPIANSPITVDIKCHPKELGTINKKITFSQRCFGLSLSPDGNLLVVTRSLSNITHSKSGLLLGFHFSPLGRVQVFDRNLTNINGSLSGVVHPYGIATDSSHNVYVMDQAFDILHKYTKECTMPVESCPAMPLSDRTYAFGTESCNGLKISKDEELYVCDAVRHQIKVYNTDLTGVRNIGRRGNKPCQFNSPHDLSFDSQGNIYITDSKNFRVQVLTQDGEFIRTFGTKGDKPGEFLCPNWIHVDGKFVYVTDYRSRYVSVFNVSGKFIHRFGADILGHPEGIVVDEDGFVYVADSDKRMVFVF